MNLHPHGLRQTRRLAANAAVAPDTHRQAPDFTLEPSCRVPYAAVLIANHLPQISCQVDHHRYVPFGDGNVKTAPGVAGANAFLRESEAVQLVVTRGADLDPLEAGHVRKVLGRKRTGENLDRLQQLRRQRPHTLFRLDEFHVYVGNPLQLGERCLIYRDVNKNVDHGTRSQRAGLTVSRSGSCLARR